MKPPLRRLASYLWTVCCVLHGCAYIQMSLLVFLAVKKTLYNEQIATPHPPGNNTGIYGKRGPNTDK